jgi:membrane protease YdiL (CAAX protease family)
MHVETTPQRLIMNIVRFPVAQLAVLYFGLTYLHLSGFFFRKSFTQGPVQGLIATLFAATMMLIFYAAIVRFTERRAVTELALPAMGREFGIGLVLGAGLYTSCILILMVLGIYRVNGFNDWHILLPGLAVTLATGVYEELFFRGGVFRLAERWFGTWGALVVSSLVFGYVHMSNDAATLRGIISISTWAGILLAATFVLTRRLWLGIGLHAAWNYTQGSVYSTIVSGNEGSGAGFIKPTMDGPDWLTGGSFGVEASVIALLVCTTAGVAMLVVAVRRGNVVAPCWKRQEGPQGKETDFGQTADDASRN